MAPKKNRIVHFLSTATVRTTDSVLAAATTFVRGDTLELTPDIIALNADRNGNTLFDLSDVEQIDKFGQEIFRDGVSPDDVNAWDGDPFLTDHLREQLLNSASNIPDRAEYDQAVRAIISKFGRKNTQTSMAYKDFR